MDNTLHKRETFNLVPELYDEIRPGYPAPVFELFANYAQLSPTSRIVEVGPGTGQLSKWFIDRGYNYLGIDLGKDLVEFASAKFARNPNAEFIHSSFESWNNGGVLFDLLAAAQSFHWIEPEQGIKKAADVLSRDGVIALIWNLDESHKTEFWIRGAQIHNKYLPDTPGNQGTDLKSQSENYRNYLRNSPYFSDLQFEQFNWQTSYSADEWIKMRNTFSPDLQLSEEARKSFHGELRTLIESLGGSFVRYYKTVCILGRRAAE